MDLHKFHLSIQMLKYGGRNKGQVKNSSARDQLLEVEKHHYFQVLGIRRSFKIKKENSYEANFIQL